MITEAKQNNIISAIKRQARAPGKQRLMFLGAVIALEDEAPPFWLVAAMTGRESEVIGKVPDSVTEEDEEEDERVPAIDYEEEDETLQVSRHKPIKKIKRLQ